MSTVSIDRFVDLSELRRRDLAPFYRIRPSKPLRVTTPTFRPKPRRIPRMLNSTSISRPRSCLRATNSARTSCEPIDLACTGRNAVEYRTARTKPEIALAEIDRVIATGVRFACVLADAGYGLSAPFRHGLRHSYRPSTLPSLAIACSSVI